MSTVWCGYGVDMSLILSTSYPLFKFVENLYNYSNNDDKEKTKRKNFIQNSPEKLER